MGAKEDVLRALEYGKDPYYQSIREQPSYQLELERVRRDYNERTWIDFSGFLPKFTTEEFEKRRSSYQAKYGNTINIPGFSDVIHIIPKARISAEERAAHLWAIKRGLPSPLIPAQLQTLQYKKFRFLKALASPTPTWAKNIGAVSTVLDNVEDGLVTISVLGRIAAKIAPRLAGKLIPGVGWVLLGSDILNALNLISWVTFSANGAKRKVEGLAERNPFHSKAAANRAFRIKRSIPSIGEILEILQTTDQLFGVGLCLGGIMGVVTDMTTRVMTYSHQDIINQMPPNPNVDDLTRWANEGFASDVDKFKKLLTDQYQNFKDEAYRLKQYDEKLRNDMMRWGKETQGIIIEKIKTVPEKVSTWFSNTLIGSMIMNTGKDTFLKEDHTNSYMMLNSSIEGLLSWWIDNEPLEAFKDIRSFKFRAPEPTDETTIDFLESRVPGWQNTIRWPHIEKEYATLEEIVFTYAPLIKDSFQTYAFRYSHEWEAMIAAQQTVEFTKNVMRAFSDDHQVKVGETAYFSIAKDMAREIYLFPPDIENQLIDQVAEYIGNYERQTGSAPPIKDVARFGESIGLKWMRSFPRRAFAQAAEIFPEWQAIQDQLEEIFVAD
ncbi:MAG: hypothetical protein FJ110_05545 [Deltaproteobacteria bacterium]|nr:hypothetical protein [Deltaproteobacteria bacterium]